MSKVQPQQTLFDFALQTTGSIESAFEIALANNISTTASLVAGAELADAAILQPKVLNYYTRKKITVATDFGGIQDTYWLSTGIWSSITLFTSDGIWKSN